MKEYVLPIIDFLLFDEEDILTASAAVNAWATMGDSVLDDTVSQPKIVNINTDKVKSFD